MAFAYHYTDNRGISAILRAGYIRPSLVSNGRCSCSMGEGVYLTTRPPSSSTGTLLINNYGTTNWDANMVSNFVRFPIENLGRFEEYDGGRIVIRTLGRDGLCLHRAVSYGHRNSDGSVTEHDFLSGRTVTWWWRHFLCVQLWRREFCSSRTMPLWWDQWRHLYLLKL